MLTFHPPSLPNTFGEVRPRPGEPITRCDGDPDRARHEAISVLTDASGEGGLVGGESGCAVAYDPDDGEATSLEEGGGAFNEDGGGGA
jgi:hypothetical protein